MKRSCVTGATGFVGAHVARMLAERGHEVRVTYRDETRLTRLSDTDVEPVRADVLDRAAMRRAVRGADVLFHTAGYVASRPADRVFEINALSVRVALEAAAAEGVGRVVVTSSVGALGPADAGELIDEGHLYRGTGLAYADAKHEGEAEAFAAAARLGVEVVVVEPAYVLGVPVDHTQPGETSTRVIGNYLQGRLPAVMEGGASFVDVDDVAAGHLAAADRGASGERYVLGGHNLAWCELIERVAELSGVRHPIVVLPPEMETVARVQRSLRLPLLISPEAYALMGADWRCSSRKAKRELDYGVRSLDRTLHATIEWYQELIEAGAFRGRAPSSLSLASAGLRVAERAGLFPFVRAAERWSGRQLLAGTRE
ncbi:MAG TPA: SDR family NAD(P)-dependent oxidoreductase [Thermoleophilaceae bacterium]